MKAAPSISACMIVKNEEKSLPTCLRSIKDHVDEIIVVDTGSTDRTVKIAESFGARVCHHPWENDFSKHRNQSLSYARGDWILYIDADEELLPGSGQLLHQAIHVPHEVDALTVVLECPFGEAGARAYNNAIRVFRNQERLRFEGRVHNWIKGVRNAVCSQIHIFHHGYVLDRETRLRRFIRTTELLKKDIQEDPTNPRPHHFLGASYLSEGMAKEAAQEAEEAIIRYEGRNETTHNYLWSLYIASSAHLELGGFERAWSLARKGIETHPDHLDSHYILAVICFRKEDHGGFQYHKARYLETKSIIEQDPDHFGQMVHNTYASEWILYLFDACIDIRRGETARVQESQDKAKILSPDPYVYHTTFGKLLTQTGHYDKASEELAQALEMHPNDTNLIWILSHVCEKLGKGAEQIAWLEKLITTDPQFPNAHFQAGLALMRLEKYKAAADLFRKASSLDPNNRLARINEALCLRGMGNYEESLRLSQEIRPASKEESRTLLLNMACCHDAVGQYDHAIESFVKLEQESPDSLEASVYLSRLFLKRGEFEPMVAECDHLLKLLNVDRNTTLQNLADLGALYSIAGEHLVSSLGKSELSTICSDISRVLGYKAKDPANP